MKKLLEFNNVKYFYQTKESEVEALRDISFSLNEKDFTSLVGPSGCGKTTILSLTAGLLFPSEGNILLDGSHIKRNDDRLGYMFQRDHLFEWRTIWQNITLGLELQTNKKNPAKIELAENLLKKYDLYTFKDKKPRQLSGGMRQRVALIRTLVLQPQLLLLDEPFSALDFQTRLKVCDDVYAIIKGEEKTALLVTHDISEAISMSDKIIILTKRPASIKETLSISIGGKSPLRKREDPGFAGYFDKIWRSLS